MHFKRLLGYTWPHKRYLFPALACIFIMAVAFCGTLGSMFPILKVMVEPEGLHGWVDKKIAEKRLDCSFAIHSTEMFHRAIAGVPEHTAKIVKLETDSPLHQGGVCVEDFVRSAANSEATAVEVFAEIATADDKIELKFTTADGKTTENKLLVLPPLGEWDVLYRHVRAAVALIPGGQSSAERMRTLIVVLCLLMVVVLVGNTARLSANYLTTVVNMRAIIDLRRQMYSHVLSLPLSRFSENTSDTMSKFVQDMNDILRGLNNFFQKLVAEPIKAAGVVVIALRFDWKLTLVVLLGAPFAIIVFRSLGKRIRRANRKLLIGYGLMLGRLESTLTGMRVVKAYTRESHERRQLFRIDRSVLRQQLRMGFIEALTSPMVEVAAFFAAAGAILYFANDLYNDKIHVSEFLLLIVCMAAIFDPVRKLSAVYPKLQRANAAAQRVFELIDSPSEYDKDADGRVLAPLTQTIVFDNVTFTYPNATRPAVHDFSLTVNKGEVLAIVGPNGSGKTTLLSLLLRFFSVDSGRILIDGQDISDVTLRSLRQQFSLITQESVMFPESVGANIAYGRPDAVQAEIEAASRKAFADEFIRQMPDKYDTMVGEHGATLSGGQRQRVAIARAVLRDAPILVFDEATSQVDPESEMKIHQALETILQDRTAFIIAHRHSTIAGADRIAVMDEGKLIAVDTHDELAASCPLYRRLYETQLHNMG